MKRLLSSPNPIAWVIKMLLAGIAGAVVLTMGQLQSVTVHDFTVSFASIPLVVILAVEFIDKISDRFDYMKMTAKLIFGVSYRKLEESQAMKAMIISAFLAAAAFFLTLFAIANAITLNLSTYSPGTLLSAAIIALYIIAPETGDDELLLMLWLAATIATKGHYFTLLGNLPVHP